MHDAKTHLSRYVSELGPGEVLVLCNRNRPVAELRSLKVAKRRVPKIGVAKGEFRVPPSFFEPLPDDLIAAFQGD